MSLSSALHEIAKLKTRVRDLERGSFPSGALVFGNQGAGMLTLNGVAGINLQLDGATLLDVGVTNSAKVTLAAGISLNGAAGTGGLSLGSMTGATALPTGNLSWSGASTKTLSFSSSGNQGYTTSGSALINLDGGGGINFYRSSTLIMDLGITSNSALTLAGGKSLAGAAGAGGLSLGSMTGNAALPTGSLSWAGDATKTLSLVAQGSSTIKTTSGNLLLDAASNLNLGTVDATQVTLGNASATLTINGSTSIAAGKSLSFAAGAGGLDASALTGALKFGAGGATLSFFGVAAAARQTGGGTLTNNIASGGLPLTFANFTDLSTYANDANTIRNNQYQIVATLTLVWNALRTYGLLT